MGASLGHTWAHSRGVLSVSPGYMQHSVLFGVNVKHTLITNHTAHLCGQEQMLTCHGQQGVATVSGWVGTQRERRRDRRDTCLEKNVRRDVRYFLL